MLPIPPLSIYVALTFNQALCINLACLSLMETYLHDYEEPMDPGDHIVQPNKSDLPELSFPCCDDWGS